MNMPHKVLSLISSAALVMSLTASAIRPLAARLTVRRVLILRA